MNVIDEFADVGLCLPCGAYWACECGVWRPGSGGWTEMDIGAVLEAMDKDADTRAEMRKEYLRIMRGSFVR